MRRLEATFSTIPLPRPMCVTGFASATACFTASAVRWIVAVANFTSNMMPP